MMEQEELLDFKALKAKFQQEDALKLMNKPAIPQKPKLIPPPPSGTHVTLISSINAAVENRMAPRVVFKDDKPPQTLKPTSPQSAAPKSKNKDPSVKPELVDKKQKREADIIMQAMKDKKLPMVLPVTVPAPTPEPDSPTQTTKPATPKKKGISFFKKPLKPAKVKAGTVESVSPPISPSPPSPPSSGSTPVVDTLVAQIALIPPIPVIPTPPSSPDVPPLDVPEISPPSIPQPEVLAPEDAALQIPDPELPASETTVLSVLDLESSTPAIAIESIPEPDIPVPDILTQIAPEVAEVPELDFSVSDIPAPEISVPDEPALEISELDIPTPIIPPPEIPDSDAPDPEISDLVIPDPIIQDVDVTDPSIPDVTSLDPPASFLPTPLIPASVSLAVSRTPSPEQVASPEAASTPLPPELPPAPVEFAEVEDAASETQQESSSASTEETPGEPLCPIPTKPVSALSVLERAEEFSPEKRTTPSDQRILDLLEKAKKKHAGKAVRTPSPSLSPSVSPVPPVPPVPPVRMTPNQADHTPSVSPTLSLPELPPVDYENSTEKAGADQGQPVSLVNGFDHRQVSPILEEPAMEEAQAEVHPATPVRKPLPPIPSLGPAPDKPHRPPVVDLSPYQLISQIPEPQEEDVGTPAPEDFSQEEPVVDARNLSPVVPECEDVQDIGAPEVEIPECGISESSTLEEAVSSAEPEAPKEALGALDEVYEDTELGPPVAELPDTEAAAAEALPDTLDSPVSQDAKMPTRPQESPPGTTDLTTNKKKSKKRKSPPKNPYADSQPAPEETQKSGWFKPKKSSAEIAEEKEQKRREKQREKELEKEREREKKEQKEREKKENEMKKKFKITGQEEPMYEAKVTVDCKGKNNDLPVKSGDLVSIIRTTNCPKGKWLARDSTNKYGYISVKSVELDIKEMLELGKKVKTLSRANANSQLDGEPQNLDSRMSNHYELSQSYSDDDEWNDDDEHEPLSPTELSQSMDNGLYSTLSIPDTVSAEPESLEHNLSDANTENPQMHARHEALQKLSTFFKQPASDDTTLDNNPIKENKPSTEVHLTSSFTEEVNPEVPDIEVLPPPDLYADVITEESLYTYSN
ncbi:uncharacterized protein LOC143116802 [Alosa pseudoharengus]|uniref:uncharacterized protein LOC143116802 n=1 Tax=Alosa pseudoharengus TaxID=34774 RepID=UPI003F8A4ED2